MSRWLEETGGTTGAMYAARFAALAASGADLHGEAAYVDALVDRGARILDAGCGTGRVAEELARRGHRVTGVDSDASMLSEATSPDVAWHLADLAELDLGERFDLIVAAGNVMVFVAPGTEATVVERLGQHLRPGGLLVSGWRTDRLRVDAYSAWTASAGLEPVARHASWQGAPWSDGTDWCVAVDRSAPAVP